MYTFCGNRGKLQIFIQLLKSKNKQKLSEILVDKHINFFENGRCPEIGKGI